MKELILFRIFALFPLIGILIPDVANLMYGTATSIPAEHIIVEISLFVCIIICSAGIWVEEYSSLKTTAHESFRLKLNAGVLEKTKVKTKKHTIMPRQHRGRTKQQVILGASTA